MKEKKEKKKWKSTEKSFIDRIVKDVKKKKELRQLDDSFVEEIVCERLKGLEVKFYEFEKFKRTKIYKTLLKNIRKVLREIYGLFIEKNYEKRFVLLENLKSLSDIETHKKILLLHKSTKERLPFYDFLYSKIFSVTGKPKKILDLGCGLNPLSFPFMKLNKVKYLATELTEEDCKFINEYFKKFKIDGKAIVLNLLKTENLSKLPKVDVCFAFKLLDTLETLKKGISEDLLKKVKAKFIVVSFPTKTIGQKKKISTKRLVWFRKLIKKMKFVSFEIENEIFFIIKR